MDINFCESVTLDSLHYPPANDRNIQIKMLRLDKIHPLISGNKWFKLKDNITEAKQLQATSIVTFGGSYSNHLIATAAMAQQHGLKSIGVVRGLHSEESKTATLKQCEDYGMHLHFISREEYTHKNDEDYIRLLNIKYPNAYIIPEGGNNELGRHGTKSIATYIPEDTNIIAVPVGTGATISGIAIAMSKNKKIWGFTAIKNGAYLHDEITKNTSHNNIQLFTEYHFGGFAKHDNSLINFMNQFYETQKIPLDFVYTGKMLYGIFDLIKKNKITTNQKIVAIHTGGLQGNSSIHQHLIF